jgi:hypothetical protein
VGEKFWGARKETNSMSLAYRLREASDVKNMVVKLREELKAALQDGIITIALHPAVPDLIDC